MSSASQKKFSSGDILGHMASDSLLLLELIPHCVKLIMFPINIGMEFLFLKKVSIALFWPFMVLVLMCAIHINVLGMLKLCSKQMLHYHGERIKVIEDVLSSIRVLKMNAWESVFQDKIESFRKLEVKYIKKQILLEILASFTFQFGVYVMLYVGFDSSSKSNIVNTFFLSLSFLKELRSEIVGFPKLISYFVEV